QTAAADGAGDLGRTTLALVAVKGGVSGGTVASLKGQISELQAAPQLRRVVADPYALSPDRSEEPDPGDGGDPSWGSHDGELGSWLGPFVMAGSNTRVVRRS